MHALRQLLPAASLLLFTALRAAAVEPVVPALPPPGPALAPVGFYASVSEQFTHFGSLRLNGHRDPNPLDQSLDSSITTTSIGYHFTERCALQLNVPYLYRSYTRAAGFTTATGSVSGLGDIEVVTKYTLVQVVKKDALFLWDAYAGVKLPTGESRRLQEDQHEVVTPGAPPNAIHGHDLALGSGSYDVILGTSEYLRVGTGFVTETIQYNLRTKGTYDYRYANLLTISGGPGVYLILDGGTTLAVQAVATFEYKGKDEFRGQPVAGTGLTALYAGPRVVFTWERLSASLGLDLPVITHNSGLQAVPSYRLTGGLALRF